MFHGKKRLNTQKNAEENEKGSKTYKSKRKTLSKHAHSRKKRLEDRLKSSTFSHGNYDSDFVGAKRLTKCVGFLAKGKISDSISRLEKSMPDGVKARTEQDLLKVLKFSDESNVKHQNVSLELTNQNSISSQNEISLSSSGNSYCSPYMKRSTVDENKFAYSLNAPNSKFSSVNLSPENVADRKRSELSICREIILNRLHFTAKDVNKELFTGISNLDRVKKEFLAIRNEYNSARQTLSSSNNCESSQETFTSKYSEPVIKESFKLNPVLTQETAVTKDLESMFPCSQEDDSSDSDVQVIEEPELQNEFASECCKYKSESSKSSSDRVNRSFPLKPCSSASSSESPVWKPDISPVKFIPDFPPTPKLYYRQKMF